MPRTARSHESSPRPKDPASLGLARLACAVSRSRQRRHVRRFAAEHQARNSLPRLDAMERGPATRRRPAARPRCRHAHRPLSRSGVGDRPLRVRPLGAPGKFFVAGCRVGSPPDDFSPDRAGLVVPSTRCRGGIAPTATGCFSESIRKSLRHGGALRIDHVMRLFRLYWIPRGPRRRPHGAYVRDTHSADPGAHPRSRERAQQRCHRGGGSRYGRARWSARTSGPASAF